MSFKDWMTYKRILIRHIYTSVISWWECSRLSAQCNSSVLTVCFFLFNVTNNNVLVLLVSSLLILLFILLYLSVVLSRRHHPPSQAPVPEWMAARHHVDPWTYHCGRRSTSNNRLNSARLLRPRGRWSGWPSPLSCAPPWKHLEIHAPRSTRWYCSRRSVVVREPIDPTQNHELGTSISTARSTNSWPEYSLTNSIYLSIAVDIFVKPAGSPAPPLSRCCALAPAAPPSLLPRL